jgi:hypothetical protein
MCDPSTRMTWEANVDFRRVFGALLFRRMVMSGIAERGAPSGRAAAKGCLPLPLEGNAQLKSAHQEG